ncbi:MAG: amidohydrolase [Robiginitomaculum sp.]|nr:MAG: amidohydrolase [Robiginitomaculum sp.]
MALLSTALLQMRSGTDPDRNFEQARELILTAAKAGATLIATPENTGLLQTDRPKMLAEIKPEPETRILQQFQHLAAELNISLLIGSLAIKLSPDKAANRSYAIDPQGQIVARYDKIHLFDVAVSSTETWRESDHIQPGKRAVLADLAGAKIGLTICYDLRFAALYRALAQAGAQILSVPAAFTRVTGKAHWKTLLRARAIENAAFVIAAAQGGVHEDGRRTWGHTMIIDPWGKVMAELDHDEPGLLQAELDLELVAKTRRRIPVLDQKIGFTGP